MAMTYNQRVRTLSIRGVITLADTNATQISLTSDDVLSYTISESCGSEGLPLGSAESASYSLTINNVGKGYTPEQFDNAEVHMEIGLRGDDGKTVYSSFGVWYVCDVSAPEQSVSIDINGYDALSTLFEADYADSASAYPTTFGSLAATICAAAGISLKTANFTNADVEIASMPEWQEELTLRAVIGYIAACAGGFARVDRNGKLEIVSYGGGESHVINSDIYTALTRSNGARFVFNALEVKDASAEEETFVRYAIDENETDSPVNTIRIEDNPLFSAGISQLVKNSLAGIDITALSLGWVGDPAVQVGDKLIVTDTKGDAITTMINTQSLSFTGGLSAQSDCTLPTLNSTNSSSYTSSGNIIDSNGNIRVTRIANFDKSVVSATVGHFEELSATTAKIDSLLASIINAVKLRAESISASDVTTDALTAATAAIITATINKLKAETITTDALYASIAEIFALKVGTLTADSIKTDQLAAALAAFQVITAGSASFDAATIRHLISAALNVENTVSGEAFIKNLRVRYAQIVAATIGDLCIKASDGNYYRIDVITDDDGTVKVEATLTTVTEDEISQGHTNAGRVILATEITAENLSAANIYATYALVNKIDAARIDVDILTAQDGFIKRLNTMDIRANGFLQMMVGDATVWRVEITSSNADVLTDGSSTTLSARVYQGAIERTNDISAARFRWRRSGDDPDADAIWNAAHRGVKSVVISGGDVRYNAVYSCDVLDTVELLTSDGNTLLDANNDTLTALEVD